MAYRNGTYVAFHAGGTTDPTASDIKYYRTMKMWDQSNSIEFNLIDSHEKTASVRDSSKKTTLAASLRKRLNNSKNMVLIITNTTKNDRDWVPFEIAHAVDSSKIPIIAAYPGFDRVQGPRELSYLWPAALRQRIDNGSASVIHVPFLKAPIMDAIDQFSFNMYPSGGGLGIYSDQAYRNWGLLN